MVAPAWLTARPAAHRGLHDAATGVIENTPTAAVAAVEAGFAVECDVQLTADGEAVVYHDFTLERLTTTAGDVDRLTAGAIAAVSYQATSDRIVTLTSFLDLIAGRVPVFVEIKSRFDGNLALTRRVAEVIGGRSEPLAVMSFDQVVVEALMALAPDRPRGIVASARQAGPTPRSPEGARRRSPANLLHLDDAKPDFLAWRVGDLPHPVPDVARRSGLPVLTWTVRTPAERQTAAAFADQIIFEGFTP